MIKVVCGSERAEMPMSGNVAEQLVLDLVVTLRPGECYAATSDGRFEQRQLETFDAGRASASLEAGNRPAPEPARDAAEAGLENAA